MARAQRFASGHEIKGPYTAKAPQIRDLNVRATWDGLPEHPAHVRVRCTVSGFALKDYSCVE